MIPMHNNDTASIDRSNTNYDTLSDTHNIVIGSIALLLAATTIVVTLVLYRLDRRRHRHDLNAPQVEPRSISRDDHIVMNDLGA